MTYLKMIAPGDDPKMDQINQEMEGLFGGMVPKLFTAMNLRTDLLQTIVQYVRQLMIEDHEHSRLTKELLAAYVSKLNSCAY